jgi:hypothetical protein
MSNYTCPLCRLQYADRSLLELHIREDHAQRDETAAAPVPPAPDPAPAPPTAPPPRSARTGSWAETARRALNRMIGRAA